MRDKQTYSDFNNKVGNVSSGEASLITLERSQKLDLLIHLISNLRQSLVICGPSGIGKTTLLDELKARKKNDWLIIDIQTLSKLSFESFQHQLFRFLILQYNEYDSQDLSSTLSVLAAQNQKVVIIIDGAALLVPGLITTLIEYAAVNQCLRIVFSLTYDELEKKKNSDQSIDECHYIDIPPLTEKQCGIFLKNISVQPDVAISLTEINEHMIRNIYDETHGVPGKIISELPTLSNISQIRSYKWIGVIVVATVVTAGISNLVFDDENAKVKEQEVSSHKVLQKYEKFETASAVISSTQKVKPKKKAAVENKALADNKEQGKKRPVIFSNESKIVSKQKNENLSVDIDMHRQEKISSDLKELPEQSPIAFTPLATNAPKEYISDIEKTLSKIDFPKPEEKGFTFDKKTENNKINKDNKAIINAIEPVSVFKKAKNRLETESKNANKLIKPDKKKEKEKAQQIKKIVDNKDDSSWILKQPKGNYTIQLMVLSRRDAVIRFLKNNPGLKKKLKFFRLNKRSKSKYAVIYGSFKDVATVSKEVKSLPAKFKKSWVRKFSKIQKKINKAS